MIPIVEKYWRNYENYYEELKEACLAFDKQDMGIIEFEDLKQILVKYGEQLDEDDIELFEKAVNISDGKIIVEGKICLSGWSYFLGILNFILPFAFLLEFIKTLSPFQTETKKSGKRKVKGKGSAKKGGKRK